MGDLIIKNGDIITFGGGFRVLKNHEIVISNGKISEITLPKANISTSSKIIDAKGRVIMPGYINCHTHLYSELAKGMSVSLAPRNFYETLNNVWWKLDKSMTKEAVYSSAFIGLLNCIKSGVTTIIDHHSSPSFINGSLQEISNAFIETGLRGILSYELSDRDGKEKFNQAIEETSNLSDINKQHNLLNIMIGLHAAFSLSDNSLKQVKSLYENKNIPIHIHVAEDVFDRDYNIYKYGLTPIQRLASFGLIDNKSILAHCVHLTDEDIKIIKSFEANIIHNPQSNLNNKVGTFNLLSSFDNDLNIALGTDGISSNIVDEYNTAYLIHKNQDKNRNNIEEIMRKLLMEAAPSVISKLFSNNIGKIEKNYASDIIIVDYIPSSNIDESNFMAHFLYGISKSRVATTIVNGKVLMEDFQLSIDENKILEIYNLSRKSADKMFGTL